MGREQIVNDVLGASAAILKVSSGVGEVIGVPGIKQASDLLLAFIHAIQNMKGNDAKRLEVANHVQALARIVADIQDDVSKNKNKYSRALEDRVMQLNSELVQYEQVASRLAAMRAPERLLRNEAISGALTDLANGVKMFCERTNTQALFNIELNQARQGQVLDEINRSFVKSSKAEIDPSTLLPFANAAYDSINVDNKSEVLPGTRVAIIEQVDRWATSTCQERVFWLRGAAGTGKSTIAKSVAAKFSQAKRLGASFFFVQDVQDLGDTRLLITTIACHLARLGGPVGAAIKAAARQQPPGLKGIWWQINDLLREPLKDLKPRPEPIIIVIDALDEASDRVSVVTSLRLLITQLVTLPVNIKLFVSSRPDPQIESVLNGASLLVLHDIEKTILDHDIKLYIECAFREIQDSKKAFQYTPEDIELLVDHSGGLFIYVSTAVKLLKDSVDPSKALKGLFKHKSDRILDELYLQVLERAFGGYDWNSDINGNSDAWDERLRTLGTIVLSQDRHSCSTLAGLLDKRTAAIRDALSHLGAVILVPQDDDLPIRILHASFTDFIVDATRCSNPRFAVDATDHHSFLAEECIHHMNRLLVENPCKISDPCAINSEVADLDERIDRFLPLHLQYASRSWAYHLSHSRYSTSLKEQLRVFCKVHLLHWLEVMSLFGRVDLATAQLDTAFNWIKANEALPSGAKTSLPRRMESLLGPTAQEVVDEVRTLLYDAYRFALQFANTITLSAGHLYSSALPFIPSCLLYQTYQSRLSRAAVKVHHSRDHAWPPYLRTFPAHPTTVCTVAVSKDGALVASGSYQALRVWDLSTGTVLAQYETDRFARSIAFSACGTRVIACTDGDVLVWNWPTDTFLWGDIYSTRSRPSDVWWGPIVVVSNTSAYFIVGANVGPGSYGEIQLWDSETDLNLETTARHSTWVTSIAFSPDDSQIVSAFTDDTMHLSELPTGKPLKVFNLPRYVGAFPNNTVTFSPNGHQIISASHGYICVWDVRTGAKLSQRKCIPQWSTNLSFSPDSTQLVMESLRDGTRINVLDTSSGACTFEGRLSDRMSSLRDESGRVYGSEMARIESTVFSSSDTCVFTGLTDGTIRIWDLSPDSKPDTSGHKDYSNVDRVAFSPDGARICTWAWNENNICVWDLSTGRLSFKLKGHSFPVLSVAFSPDSTQIISGSFDATIRIWNSVDGRQVQKLDIRGAEKYIAPVCAAISPDGTRIACGLYTSHRRFGIMSTHYHLPEQVQKLPRPSRTAITFSQDGSYVYSVLDSRLPVTQWDTRSGKVISVEEVPYNQTPLGQEPLLKLEKAWIVPVRNPSRKLFHIPITHYLPLRNFYTYGPFVVLVGSERFAILDLSGIIQEDI